MTLSDRLFKKKLGIDVGPGVISQQEERRRRQLQEMKMKLHRDLIDRINLDVLMTLNPDDARKEVASVVRVLFDDLKAIITASEKEALIKEVVDETFGLGPLEPLLADSNIDEILVNNASTVFVERFGKLHKTTISFKDDDHLRHIINRIVARVGRRIDESSPMVDARLADGSRVNAVIPPLSIDGPCMSIRRFKRIPFRPEDLVKRKSMSEKMINLMEIAVKSKRNVLISGGTGSGKTTLLNILSSFIPYDERIITIEDAAELQLQQEHVVRLETRPANLEGKGRVSQCDLLKNALRMRPDRIVLGEVRGEEALDMLQAMNTGHEGSLTTVHANTARDSIARIETMVGMGNATLGHMAIVRQIESAFHVIIQIRRYPDGIRRVESICEVAGMEQDVITLNEIVSFKQRSVDADGTIHGDFVFSDVRPRFLDNPM